MANKIQIPRKHASKKTTEEQEQNIAAIKESKNLNSWLEAKHEYFENQEKYDRMQDSAEQVMGADFEDLKAIEKAIAEKQGPTMATITGDEKPTKRVKMTIAETKLGVTMVINKEECEQLGIDINKTTKEAIQELRGKLGLKTKGVKI